MATRLLTAVLAALTAWWFVPLLPAAPTAALDSSWRLGLALACERGLVFGVDIVFTFGPLGCLVTWQYWPATYLPAIVFWLLVAGTAGWLAFDGATGTGERIRTVLALALLGLTPDSALLVLPVAFVVHGWCTRRMTPAAWLACLALGLLALTKVTMLPIVLLATVCGLALRQVDVRQVLSGVAVTVAGAAAAMLLASQPWHAIGPYLVHSLELARHYPEAMQWPVRAEHIYAPWAYAVYSLLLLSAGVTAVAVVRAASRAATTTLPRAALVLFALATIALLIRHGATRGDPPHLFPAFVGLGALLLLFFPAEGSRLRRVSWAALVPMLVLPLLMQERAAVNIPGGSIAQRAELSVAGAALLLTGKDPRARLDAAVAAFAAEARARAGPAWPGGESIDVISYDQHLLLAGDPGRWRPRPVLQSYSAYSPVLTLLNARFLGSDRAPQALVVAAQTIDERLVTMDDAAIWGVLRSHYQVSGRLGTGHLVLARRPVPAANAKASAAGTVGVDAADWVDLPRHEDGGLYASARAERTFVDRLLAVVWKPPVRFVEVRMASGDVLRFRLAASVAAGGFWWRRC